jgi:hypothetical protein
VLYWLLLGVGPITVDLPDAFAAGLTHITAKMHADRHAHDIHGLETPRKKTFRDKYGERFEDSLLLLAEAPDDDLLPPFYQELGGCQKGESERVILQREVDQSAEVLKTFVFCGLSVREIGTRMLPFSITPPVYHLCSGSPSYRWKPCQRRYILSYWGPMHMSAVYR